jgi:hypothetical protein
VTPQPDILFACYRGRSQVSSLIQWFTRSVYSHVAIQIGDEVFEAVSSGFVRSASLKEQHDKGTVVDLHAFVDAPTPDEIARARTAAARMVGTGYAYADVFRGYPCRLNRDAQPDKWFCSEAALAISWAMGRSRLLQRMLPWKATPDHIAISPLLNWYWTTTL